MKARPFIYVLLGLLAALYSIGIFWGMPSEFSPEIDADVPFAFCHILAAFMMFTGPLNILHSTK